MDNYNRKLHNSKTNRNKTNRKNRDLRLVTWNARTLYKTGALKTISEELDRYSIDIAAVQETRLPGEGQSRIGKYIFLYGGSVRGMFGTGFFIKEEIAANIKEFRVVNERITYLRVVNKWYNLNIVNAHGPTEDKESEVKETFYAELDRIFDSLSSYDANILLGDLNAKIGREEIYKATVGCESLHEISNDNGIRITNFAISKNLIIKSTCFKHKNIHKATWISPDGRTRNQIDHILIDKRHQSNILDVRCYRGADCDSDHLMVAAKLRMRLTTDRKSRTGRGVSRGFAINKLRDEVKLEEYQREIASRLDEEREIEYDHDIDIDKKWEKLKIAIKETGEKILGSKDRKSNKPWFDEECRKSVEKRREARIMYLSDSNVENREIYVMCRKQVEKIVRQKKREWEKNRVLDIVDNNNKNNMRELYAGINSIRKGYQSQTTLIKDKNGNLLADEAGILMRWKNYFDELLNVHANDRNRIESEIHTAEPEITEPTINEVRTAIKKLKNNKAAGIDDMPGEIVKYGGERLVEEIFELIREIWNKEQIPMEWTESVIIPIFKKGDKSECSNYRGISLLPTCYKVLSNVLLARLTPYAEEIIGDYQCGFRRDRSTSDQMFTIRQIMEKNWEYNKTFYQLFIDFKKAYDSIIK